MKASQSTVCIAMHNESILLSTCIPVGRCRYFILKLLLTDTNDVQRMVCIPHCSRLHNVNFNVCFGGIFLSTQFSSGILGMVKGQGHKIYVAGHQ